MRGNTIRRKGLSMSSAPRSGRRPSQFTGITGVVVLVVMALAFVPGARAQTFTVLHNFTGGADGGNPLAGLTMDQAGNLYGST